MYYRWKRLGWPNLLDIEPVELEVDESRNLKYGKLAKKAPVNRYRQIRPGQDPSVVVDP